MAGEFGAPDGAEFTAEKPVFVFREVVSAMLDGTVPFEGAITKIEKTDAGYMYTVVEQPDKPEGEQGKKDTVSEASLIELNRK